MPAGPSLSFSSAAELARADELLRAASYVDGGHSYSARDVSFYKTAATQVANSEAEGFKKDYPSVARWMRQMRFVVEETGSEAAGFGAALPSSGALTRVSEQASGQFAASSTASSGSKPNKADRKSAAMERKSEQPKEAAKPAYVKGSTVKEVDCKVVPMENREKALPVQPPRGAGATNFPGVGKKGTRYITTAIHYTNGWPHVGHAYETIQADILARFFRLASYDTFFQTGTDEHGQKIAEAAVAQGKPTPRALCDMYVQGFQGLFGRTEISEDQFIRTSQPEHYKIVQDLWKKVSDKGDIYLGEYEGWYMVREERFVTDKEAEEWKYLDPSNGKPLQRMKEPSYFFRLSKYKDFIVKLLTENADFVKPEEYRLSLISRLKDMEESGGLRDLSISRATFEWGVPVPEKVGPDGKKHVMYVWFDALTNYFSGVNFDRKNAKYWPANMHVIGKDIVWFHCVIWPAMLQSAGIPLPQSVVVHGFINDKEGTKMSKSEGNVVNPHDICDWCAPDTFRWYLCRGTEFGKDLSFSVSDLKLKHNAELCDNLGNLVNRAVNLCKGAVPELSSDKSIGVPFNVADLRSKFCRAMENARTCEGATLVRDASAATNKWLADLEPWKLSKTDPAKAAGIVRVCLEAVFVLAHLFAPFIPRAAEAILLEKLKADKILPLDALQELDKNLKAGAPVSSTSVLFATFSPQELEIDTPVMVRPSAEETAKTPAAVPAEKEGKQQQKGNGKQQQNKGGGKQGEQQGGEKKKKEKAPKAPAQPPVQLDMDQPLYSRLDLRVGKIVHVENHPDAERLYVEKIDVGEAEPRTIISGLREHYTLEEMLGRQIVTICNLEAAKMRGITSHGMVLCAKTSEGKVQFAGLPDGCKPGDHILVEGETLRKPWTGKEVKKHNVWMDAAKLMQTDDAGIPCFDKKPLTVNGARLHSDFKNAILS
ncbi:unnamed protein product [Amoebophrya sp. A25]|nr:unnamed protein product [Amoebophrya sp. A25]|eukprot:GSA25T00018977001.1